MERPGWHFALCPGRIPIRTIRTTAEASNDGAGGRLEGSCEQEASTPPGAHKTFSFTGVEIGDSAPFAQAPNRKSSPKWGGPARILYTDETGVTEKYEAGHSRRRGTAYAGGRKNSPASGINDDWHTTPPMEAASETQDLGLSPGATSDAASQEAVPLVGAECV